MAAIATLARWPAAYLAGDMAARPTWQQRRLAGLPGKGRGGEAGSLAGTGLSRRERGGETGSPRRWLTGRRWDVAARLAL